MRILTLFPVLLIACSPVDITVPSASLLPDLSVVDMAGSPPQDLAVVTGPTRIVQRTWTGSDGVVVKMVDLYDTVEKFPCGLQRASDGVARCVPLGFTLYFQDAGCTQPVLLGVPGCGYDKYVNVYNLQCGVRVASTYRTVSRITPAKLYVNSGMTCSDVSGTIPTYDIYSLVAVPPSTFAAGTFNY